MAFNVSLAMTRFAVPDSNFHKNLREALQDARVVYKVSIYSMGEMLMSIPEGCGRPEFVVIAESPCFFFNKYGYYYTN